MPMWFKGIKFNSFIRKLNRWGFRRLRKDETCDSICIFHHPMFNRFGLDAVERMTITKKGRSTTSSSASIKKEQQGEHHTLMLANSTLTATSRLPIIAPQDHRSRETYRRTATSETGIAVLHTLKIQALTQERIKALLLANHLNQLLTERALRCSPRAMSRTHIGGAEFRWVQAGTNSAKSCISC